jgi:D-alanyl-D-alanine carboxypeptidase
MDVEPALVPESESESEAEAVAQAPGERTPEEREQAASERAARRQAAARRRRLRLGLGFACLGLLVVVAVVLVNRHSGGSTGGSTRGSAKSSSAGSASGSSGGSSGGTASQQGVAQLSASGLPLGKPELPLGFGDATADPVKDPALGEPPSAGLLFDLDSGRVLWQLHAHRRLRIASLTKMMTALIAVKSDAPKTKVLITRHAINMPGSKVGMLPLGKHVQLEPLLYGLLLPSGNDAAVAIAQHVAGDSTRFVKRMNIEAARLGLGCTRYSSPSGYYDADNFSCAADLGELAHDDLAEPLIAKITRSASAILPFPIKGGKLFLYNNNPLLIYRYPGTTGLKTGYTEAAGRCLVATAQRDGERLGVVLLHSPDPATQAARLLDIGFDDVYHLRPVREPPIPPGE